MKSITSRSLLPASSCSRIWLRRSTASGALESASVWFWHTRQRSSCARSATRRSRLGFPCPNAVPTRNRAMKKSLATPCELLYERPELLLRDPGRERPDVLVADDSLLVDHVRLGYAVHAVVDADAAGLVVDRDLERIAVLLEPGKRVGALVLVVEPDDRRDARAREIGHDRVLLQARRAPGRPNVHDPYRAQHVLLRERLVR